MRISEIKNMDDLYTGLENGTVKYMGNGINNSLSVMEYTLKEIRRRKNENELSALKKIILLLYPMQLLLAYIKALKIITFRKKDFQIKLSCQAMEDIVKNIEKYKMTYELLDTDSKQVFLDMLMYRVTGSYHFSIRVKSCCRQYFSNKMMWKANMTIVDCGAFVGDTLLAFMEKNISIKNYYMYELDDDNYAKMQTACRLAEQAGINVYQRKKGVYAHSDTLFFESNGDSSQLVDYPTKTAIEVVAIDEDIGEKVDFIKMDIEGSELEAINGAAKTIKRDKPILAICIYHKQEDFWKLPLRIKEICPEYSKFWIEQYSVWDIETVLFVSI